MEYLVTFSGTPTNLNTMLVCISGPSPSSSTLSTALFNMTLVKEEYKTEITLPSDTSNLYIKVGYTNWSGTTLDYQFNNSLTGVFSQDESRSEFFTKVPGPFTSGSYSLALSVGYGSGSINVGDYSLTSVPEPSTALMGVLSILAIALRKKFI